MEATKKSKNLTYAFFRNGGKSTNCITLNTYCLCIFFLLTFDSDSYRNDFESIYIMHEELVGCYFQSVK